jgi:hypothetical protein
MTSQLRIYGMADGAIGEFLALWRDHIVPAREVHGFAVVGAWLVDAGKEFVWIVSHPADDGWEHAEAAYYASPERASLPTDPAQFILSAEVRLLESQAV